MKSPLAEQAQRELVELSRQMTPEQRLQAFRDQSRLLTERREAGRKHRRKQRPSAAR